MQLIFILLSFLFGWFCFFGYQELKAKEYILARFSFLAALNTFLLICFYTTKLSEFYDKPLYLIALIVISFVGGAYASLEDKPIKKRYFIGIGTLLINLIFYLYNYKLFIILYKFFTGQI